MRRFLLHRWAVVFLLLSRLVVGEFSHAMPHAVGGAEEMAAASGLIVGSEAPCPDHATGSPLDAGGDEPAGSSGMDCCERGSCVCPCLHAPAALGGPAFTFVSLDHPRAVACTPGIARCGPSGLFRPPA